MNGYALKLIPQKIRKVTVLAAVIPPNHPALPQSQDTGAVKTPEVIEALSKLERNGMVTADVDLAIKHEGDQRHIQIQIQVVQVDNQSVVHKDVLIFNIIMPLPQSATPNIALPIHSEANEGVKCAPHDWLCRASSAIKAIGGGCRRPGAPFRQDGHHKGPHGQHPHGHHRRPDRPRHRFTRFLLSVVIPVVIGAAAGVAIGILSVFVAEFVGGVIIKIRGRRNVEYREIDMKDDEDELPVYEEQAPAYTDEKVDETEKS
jgi:hypothetical protein